MNVQDITGGSTWAIAAAAFSNPMYLNSPLGATDNSVATGFQITPGGSVVIGFSGDHSGQTVEHQQTMDPSGASGWFAVLGCPNSGGAPTSSGSDADATYVFPCTGVLHRIKVTALASGTIEARIRLESESFSDAVSAATGLATEATQLDVLAALETVPAYLPPEPVVPSTDTTLTPGTINLSAVSGDQTLVSATAAQSTRVHRLFATFTGGASESLVTVKSGATAIGYFRVPTAGLVVDLEFSSYWHYKTANNEAFILSPSVALNIAGSFQYVKGA